MMLIKVIKFTVWW